MIIACQSCCCFAFPNTPPSLFFPTVFHILASTGAGVLQMFGCLPLTPCNLLAANQQPPLHYCSDTCWYAELNRKLMSDCVAGNLQMRDFGFQNDTLHVLAHLLPTAYLRLQLTTLQLCLKVLFPPHLIVHSFPYNISTLFLCKYNMNIRQIWRSSVYKMTLWHTGSLSVQNKWALKNDLQYFGATSDFINIW